MNYRLLAHIFFLEWQTEEKIKRILTSILKKNCLVWWSEIQSMIMGALSKKIQDCCFSPSHFSGPDNVFFFFNIMRIYILSNAYHEHLKHKWHIQGKNKGKQLNSILSESGILWSHESN